MRGRIAEKAAELFAESGYAGVSMRMIAGKLGIKAASLYNHYPDKESLYFAALAHAFEKRFAAIEAAAISDKKSAEQRLTETLAVVGRATIDDPVSTRLLQRELLEADDRRLRELTETLFQEPFDRIVGLLEELDGKRNAATLSLYVTALIHGYFSLAPIWRYLTFDGPIPDTPEKLAGDLVDALTSYLSATA